MGIKFYTNLIAYIDLKCLIPVNYEYISIVPNTNWNLCYYKAINRCDMYAECNTPLPINPDSNNNGQIFINQLIFLSNFNFTVEIIFLR